MHDGGQGNSLLAHFKLFRSAGIFSPGACREEVNRPRQKVGLDIPKIVAKRVVKERRHRQFLEMPPGSDKVN